MAQYGTVLEIWDNYQKQTYRNRCRICTDTGKLLLTVPIAHAGGEQGRQLYKEVRLKNEYQWQNQHWRTLQTAYRSSPFFEFYEDQIAVLFTNSFNFLIDFNRTALEVLCKCLGLECPFTCTDSYQVQVDDMVDVRFLANAKKILPFVQTPYHQVFVERHGFVPNTSVLDLLFNEGPHSLGYLKRQELAFLNV